MNRFRAPITPRSSGSGAALPQQDCPRSGIRRRQGGRRIAPELPRSKRRRRGRGRNGLRRRPPRPHGLTEPKEWRLCKFGLMKRRSCKRRTCHQKYGGFKSSDATKMRAYLKPSSLALHRQNDAHDTISGVRLSAAVRMVVLHEWYVTIML